MKRITRCLLVLCAIGFGANTLRAGDFLVRLGLKHGHLREVYFGCAAGATDGYDRDQDDLAPPRGIQTGYTVFLVPGGKMPPFYKDVRGPAPVVTWEFFAEVFKTKVVQISWDTKALPATHDFSIRTAEACIDMHKVDHVDVAATQTLKITATERDKTKAKAGKTDE